MDSWPNIPQEVPDLIGSANTGNTNDWEEWLRWDPSAVESFSPDFSSKDSSNSPPPQHALNGLEPIPWLNTGINPQVIGEDVSSALSDMPLFSANVNIVDPFVFGAGIGNSRLNFDAPLNYNQKIPSDITFWSNHISSNNVSNKINGQRETPSVSDEHTTSPRSQHDTLSPLSPQSLAAMPVAITKKKAGRKRKSEAIVNDSEPPQKKTSHNVIEKRYRNNLNDKILELRDSVPSLRAMSKQSLEDDGSEDLGGLTPAHKSNKSTIMAKATEYIKHLEKRNKTLSDDLATFKARLNALESPQVSSDMFTGRSRQSSINSPVMIMNPNSPVSHSGSIVRRHQNHMQSTDVLPELAEDDPDSKKVRKGRSSVIGKVMVASMAGLMVMEGFDRRDSSNVPSLVKRGLSSDGADATNSRFVLPIIKFSLVLTAILYLALPWLWFLTKSEKRSDAEDKPIIRLTAAPSLASPVETKRKAWLTAIQAVWVPRPFLLEVVAVAVRMTQLSIRRLIGFDRYTETFGGSKEHEAARIKAWDIAIDAQLAGGDAEVSYYRLLLTLMASGTLPDSPIRLMQKAVHFRIFFWEVANAGYGNLFMFKDFTARIGQIYWDSARKLHHDLSTGAVSKVDELDRTIELLPPHLAALIDLPCDQVLTDEMIQRAYNLAWNRPSAENTRVKSTLDKIVEDPSIRSPLEAVAAWFTNIILDEALGLTLLGDAAVEAHIRLAVDTAPPASSTLTRALVTKAIIIDTDREKNIATALESIPPASVSDAQSVHLDVVDHMPVTPEVRTALILAKMLSFIETTSMPNSQAYAAAIVSNMDIPATHLTTLTAVATFKIIEITSARPDLAKAAERGLKQAASNLRLWVGTRCGRQSGLQRKEKAMIVSKCVTITKKVGGWCEGDTVDSGYGSAISRRSSDE